MTTRERVLRTLRCEETDRVPLYDLLRNDAAFEHLTGEKLPALRDDKATRESLHRIAATATGRLLDMTRSVGFGPVVERDVTTEDGFVHHEAPWEKTSWIVRRPFDDVPGAAAYLESWSARVRKATGEIERNPAPYRERYHAFFLATQKHLGDTVNLLAQHGIGLDDVRHSLGMELFAYVDADRPELISEALEAKTRFAIAECHAVADSALSPVVLTYGDIAFKGALLHSPAWLRREFYPRLARLNAAWHEHGLSCLFHSDGQLMEALDDLIAAGIDGVNPIETVAGMSLGETRRKVGPRIYLAGGIDMSQLLSNGEPEEVREVCRQAVRDAYPGYFMGSTTEADNSCRLENLLVMYDVSREPLR
jgi:uroporphyrinogen decarboxylase